MGHGHPALICPCRRAGLSPGCTEAPGQQSSTGVQGQRGPIPGPTQAAAGEEALPPKAIPAGPLQTGTRGRCSGKLSALRLLLSDELAI